MSIGRTREENELIRHLADTLVQKEVIEPLDKIGWRHGDPPPPDYGTTPKPEGAPAPAASPAALPQDGLPVSAANAISADPASAKANAPDNALDAIFETLRDPQTGLIAGKYKTGVEALKGAGHLVTLVKTSFSQRDAALAEAERLRAESAGLQARPAASPVAVPTLDPRISASRPDVQAAQVTYDAVLSEVVENGGVFDKDLAEKLSAAERDLRRAESRAMVDEVLSQRDSAQKQEQDKWSALDKHVRENYAEALDHTEEIGLHVQADPLLQAAVSALVAQGRETQASDLAWDSFKRFRETQTVEALRANAENKEIVLSAKGQVRQEAVDAARKDAGIIVGSAGGQGVHEVAGAGPTREIIEKARQEMRWQGDAPGSPAAKRFRDLVIGPTLDPSIFGQ